jgi:hypothetical protein
MRLQFAGKTTGIMAVIEHNKQMRASLYPQRLSAARRQ